MRAALWLLALFGIAVAVALFAGNNQGTVTVFWPPYRLDLSLNLVLLVLVGLFVVLHMALRALSLLFALPGEARRWRLQHQERAMHVGLLDALSHLAAGRFIRARKAAEAVLSQEKSLARSEQKLVYAGRLRAVSHLLAAESAHGLQDKASRQEHVRQALEQTAQREAQETREGVQLRAARWAFDDRDARTAARLLDELPQGASRRTVALRLRFKVARRAGDTLLALETARLLAKHRAFSEAAGQSLIRGLALELIQTAHDSAQLLTVWGQLDGVERLMPVVAIHAAERMAVVGGEVALARRWLVPVWERMLQQPDALDSQQRVQLVRVLEQGFALHDGAPDAAWLTRIESAQMSNPRDAGLQYLAGVACKHLQLWGKAQQLLTQALPLLQDAELRRSAWRALAELAERRGDEQAAADAYRNAAKR
jgi:HemY protein